MISSELAATVVPQLLEQIVSVLRKEKDPDISLISGRGGHMLLYAYLAKYLESPQYLDDAVETLNACLEYVDAHQDSMPHLYTYSNGIVGLAWVVQHLIHEKALPADADEILEGIDEFILTFLELDIEANNFDPLHGYVGTGAYFLERYPTEIAQRGLARIVEALAHSVREFNGYLVWGSGDAGSPSEEIRCDCGLAHGSVGIIIFLSEVYKLGLFQERISVLLEGAVKGLFHWGGKQEQQYFFPDFLLEYPATPHTVMIRTSRLGWCYGDLSTGRAIIEAARILDKPDWIEQVRTIVLHHCAKVPSETNIYSTQVAGVIDATLCHGVLGIAYLFQLLWQDLGDAAIGEAAERWRQVGTNELAERLAGGDLRSVHNGKLQDTGILNGYAGIALALLGCVNQPSQSWSRCLFLY